MAEPEDIYPDGPYRPAHWPEWARDEIVNVVTIRFDWRDTLLILLGRTVTCEVRTAVEKPPARTHAQSKVWAHRFRWPWHRDQGYSPAPITP